VSELFSRYMENLRRNLKLDNSSEKEIIREMETHVEDKYEELRDAGLSDDEATRECIGLLGSAKMVAHQIYEVHNQGNWRQAILASMPHLFFAMIFTLKWLVGIEWLPVLLGTVFVLAFYGWCHGKPNWLFPWLSYALLPVVTAGVLLLYLPQGWAWVTILVYIPLILWLLCYIAIKSIKRDWLYIAFMLLPVPTFVGWFLVIQPEIQFSGFNLELFQNYSPWIVITFLLLAGTVAAFILINKRWLKITLLFFSELLSLIIVTLVSERLGFFAFCGLIILMFSILLIPAFLENRIGHQKHPS